MSDTDTIHKERIIKAPRSRVWAAISDSQQFGTWFKIRFEEPFRANTHLVGVIQEPGWEGVKAHFWIERIEPEHTFTYRWIPGGDVPTTPDSPKTLVTFALADHEDGTRLTITESGFDNLPVELRAKAFRDNDGGWAEQIQRIDRHVTSSS